MTWHSYLLCSLCVILCGRGAEDGFLLQLDSSGRPIYATCYGGSGSDRITAVLFDSAFHVPCSVMNAPPRYGAGNCVPV